MMGLMLFYYNLEIFNSFISKLVFCKRRLMGHPHKQRSDAYHVFCGPSHTAFEMPHEYTIPVDSQFVGILQDSKQGQLYNLLDLMQNKDAGLLIQGRRIIFITD